METIAFITWLQSELDKRGIGDVIQIDDVTLTVNGFEFSDGDKSWKPKDGHRYAIVDVTLENGGKESINILHC